MLIVCPNCAAAYQVNAATIGAAGRTVRCVRCRNVWQELPPAEAPALALAEPPEPEAASDDVVAAFRAELTEDAAEAALRPPDDDRPESGGSPQDDRNGPSLDDLMASNGTNPPNETGFEPATDGPAAIGVADLPAAEAPPLAPAAPASRPVAGADVETTAIRRVRPGARKRRSLPKGPLAAVIVGLVVLIAAAIGWRGTIVRHAPQMASLYRAIGLPVNLRGLAFKEIQVARDMHDGVPVLVVEGTIVSAASVSVEIPRLRFALQNEAGGEVYSWTAMPTQEVLGAGETLPFRSRLASPPSEGRTVTVRFFNRRDAVAGLR